MQDEYYGEKTNRNKSVTLFGLMALALISVVLYVYVISPRLGRDALGSNDLILDSPVQRWNLRYAENGIIPFCKDGREWLSIEVAEGSDVYSSNEGVVDSVEDGIVTVRAESNIFVQYSDIANPTITEGDYITKGSRIGNVTENYLNIRIKNTRRGVYECPFFYLNDYTKSILKEVEDVMGHTVLMCDCNTVSY